MGARGVHRGAFVFTRDSARELDRRAHDEFGLPTIVLMENAARGLAAVVLDELDDAGADSVLIVCGRGNNGGDGFGAARHLVNASARVQCLCETPPDQLSGDALVNARAASAMGVECITDIAACPASHAVVIDAILGTGLRGAATGHAAELIAEVNRRARAGATVVSADIPSGLDCDTGHALGPAVKAAVTVTFAGLKRGFLELEAQAWTGDIVVADIGVPRVLLEQCGRWVPELEMGEWELGPGQAGAPGPEESGPPRRFDGCGR